MGSLPGATKNIYIRYYTVCNRRVSCSTRLMCHALHLRIHVCVWCAVFQRHGNIIQPKSARGTARGTARGMASGLASGIGAMVSGSAHTDASEPRQRQLHANILASPSHTHTHTHTHTTCNPLSRKFFLFSNMPLTLPLVALWVFLVLFLSRFLPHP